MPTSGFREHFRGLEEWKAEGLPISSPSNEAVKLYDAAVTQFTGWYNDPNLGGFMNTMKSMFKSDPDFVLGNALRIGIELFIGEKNIKTDIEFKEDVRRFEELAAKNQNLTRRERKHVEAIIYLSNGDVEKSLLTLEEILTDYPTDTHALKLASDFYFVYGMKPELRDSVARVLPYYSDRKNPLTGYIYGMDAFGKEENSLYDAAIQQANTALEITPHDAWAHHAIGHCYEMQGKTKEGIEHYELREKEWSRVDGLLSHNFWHYAVYHVERLEFERALDIFEKNCLPLCEKDGKIFNLIDSSSFLYRMKLIDQCPDQKLWSRLHKRVVPHLNGHVAGFTDFHFFASLLGNKLYDQAEQFIETLDRTYPLYTLTDTLLNAMLLHEREQHEKAVDLLVPIKYKLVQLGGSDAQRDVLHQLLVMSAIKSPNPSHKNLAKNLLFERDQLKTGGSPLNNFMRQKLENYN